MLRYAKQCVARFPWLNYRARAWKSYLTSDRELRYLSVLCDPAAFSADVGAAYGAVTYWLRRYSKGVLAFEPNPDLYRNLRHTLGDDPRVELHNVALSNEEGKATLLVPRFRVGRASIDAENKANLESQFLEHRIVEVDTARLSSFSHYRIGFIKIDVEGHECAVLQGALEVIDRDSPSLLIEIEERHHHGSFDTVYGMLADFGYWCVAMSAGKFVEVSLASYPEYQQEGAYQNNYIFSSDGEVLAVLLGRAR